MTQIIWICSLLEYILQIPISILEICPMCWRWKRCLISFQSCDEEISIEKIFCFISSGYYLVELFRKISIFLYHEGHTNKLKILTWNMTQTCTKKCSHKIVTQTPIFWDFVFRLCHNELIIPRVRLLNNTCKSYKR